MRHQAADVGGAACRPSSPRPRRNRNATRGWARPGAGAAAGPRLAAALTRVRAGPHPGPRSAPRAVAARSMTRAIGRGSASTTAREVAPRSPIQRLRPSAAWDVLRLRVAVEAPRVPRANSTGDATQPGGAAPADPVGASTHAVSGRRGYRPVNEPVRHEPTGLKADGPGDDSRGESRRQAARGARREGRGRERAPANLPADMERARRVAGSLHPSRRPEGLERSAARRGARGGGGAVALAAEEAAEPVAAAVAVAVPGEAEAEEAAPERLELVGGDLAVVHQAGELAQRAVRRQLVELVLGDDAVGEEVLQLLAIGLGLLAGLLPSLLAGGALRGDGVEDGRLLGLRDRALGDEPVEDVREDGVLTRAWRPGSGDGVGVAAAGADDLGGSRAAGRREDRARARDEQDEGEGRDEGGSCSASRVGLR